MSDKTMKVDSTDTIKVGGVYRIKSDERLSEFGFYPRVDPRCPEYVKLIQAPCTQRLVGDTGAMQIPVRWQEEIREHNTAYAFKRLTNEHTGWVNQSPWPHVEQILFSTDKTEYWNQVEVTAIHGDLATIRTQSLGDRPLPYWWEMQYLANRFTVIDITANVFYPDPPGVPMIFPLLRRANVPLSIPIEKLAPV